MRLAVERLLIVNADDFGLTPGVSLGILDANRKGIVSSTTVLINLPIPPDLVAEATASSSLGLGLHLNLTFGTPVRPAPELPSLVDENGRFLRDAERATSGSPAEICLELEAQLEKFHRIFGRAPSHLDTHHFLHRRSPATEIVCDLAARHGLPFRTDSPEARAAATVRGLPVVPHFVGDTGPEPYWTEARLLETLDALPEGVTELMCHPGYVDETLTSSYRDQREVELLALCSPTVRHALEEQQVRLVNFGQLKGLAP